MSYKDSDADHTATQSLKRKRIPIPDLSQEEITRFWNCIKIGGRTECWPWKTVAGTTRYGHFTITQDGQTETFIATRVMCKIVHGFDPDKLIMRHVTCRTPPCCNPLHVIPGTFKENTEDKIRDGMMSNRRFSDDAIISMRELYATDDSLTMSDIGDIFDTTKGHAQLIITGKIWPNVGGPISTNNPRRNVSTLVAKDVIRILERGRAGESPARIQRDYHYVTVSNIHAILTGRSWLSITGPREKIVFRSKCSEERRSQIIDMARTMPILNLREISRVTDTNRSTVTKVLRSVGIEPLKYAGDIHHSAKTTSDQREQIRVDVLLGTSMRQAARDAGIRHGSIRRIVKGRPTRRQPLDPADS